jgi:hypothetical protein
VRAASAARWASISSEPYCLDARGGVRARVREARERDLGRGKCETVLEWVGEDLDWGLGKGRGGLTLEFSKGLGTSKLVALYDLTCV